MTEKDDSPEIHDCGADVAAYALGALDAAAAEVFRAHLQTCAICRDELAAFQNAVDVLPLSAPQYSAPSELRDRVFDAIAGEPRLGLRRDEPRRRPLMKRSVVALGATLAIALAAVVGIEVGSSGAPRAHVYAAQVTGSGRAEITVSGTSAKLVVRDFPPPPAGHIYEVWLQRADRPPAPTDALFSVSSTGDGEVDVPGDLHGVTKVLVTPEPDGGTRVPTHAPVISVQLS